MRPDLLFPLFADAARLPKVGPGTRKALARLLHGDESAPVIVRDILFHLPVGLVDRRISPRLAEAKDGDVVTWLVTVEAHQPPESAGRMRKAKLPYRVICHTPEGYLTLVFFHARPDYVRSVLPEGQQRVISGRFERFNGVPQITHPDIIAKPEEMDAVLTLEPVYALTAGLTNRTLRHVIAAGLATLPQPQEWLDEALSRQKGWPAWKAALLRAHAPEAAEELLPLSPARMRLAYDELLANQLALGITRGRRGEIILHYRAVCTCLASINRERRPCGADFPLPDYLKTTVLQPLTSTRRSMWYLSARASTAHSMSRPAASRSSGLKV